jgi:multidrug efflux pump subunit AcrB
LQEKLHRHLLNRNLHLLLIIASLAIGAFSVYLTPSEEEPQIIVPMADIFVMYNGASPEEVESRIVSAAWKKLSPIFMV